jgi:hypothetical protein
LNIPYECLMRQGGVKWTTIFQIQDRGSGVRTDLIQAI